MDANVKDIIRPTGVIGHLESSRQIGEVLFSGEITNEEIARIETLAKGFDAIVGLGGGKVMDAAKVVASRLGARSVMAPTIASTDAPWP